MDLGWNGGQGGRVWQKKTNSFFLSCCFITHALGHPVPIPLSLGSSPLHTQQKGMSAMMGLPFSRGEAGILTGVWGWGRGGIMEAAGREGFLAGGSWNWVGSQELPLLRGG